MKTAIGKKNLFKNDGLLFMAAFIALFFVSMLIYFFVPWPG
jgi:hypothetical protein